MCEVDSQSENISVELTSYTITQDMLPKKITITYTQFNSQQGLYLNE